MQEPRAMPVVSKTAGEPSVGSAVALESFLPDARQLAPDAFRERHGNSFLLFTAKKAADQKSQSATNLLLDGDDDEPEGRTASLSVVVYPLRPRDSAQGSMVTLGRESRQDVVIQDMSVSRFHAFAKPGPDGALVLQDAGSTNGTTVNGESVLTAAAGPPRRLKPGDNVRLGHIEVTFTDARSLREFVLRTAR
jgi:pSer/pThr/pTyr-binding forkhead associated (FHA) protein